MNSTWSHSCWYPQGSISKACNSWHVSGEGQMHRIALSLSKLVVEYSSGSWVFADWYLSSGFFCLFVCLTDCFFPFLIGAYSFIPPFFDSISDLILQAPAGTVVQPVLSCPTCMCSCQSNHQPWPQLSALVPPCCRAMLSDVCREGMTICWPGRGPSACLLGKLACTLSGNFHYLPTRQNDFAIDRGFIMSAVPFFENMDKTEREW